MNRFLLLFIPVYLLAGSNPKTATAVRTSTPPKIDGVLNEAEWQLARPITDFTQSEPQEGAPPTEKTEIRILYDDEALYFGCKMYDSDPSGIVARLARRDDEIESDVVSLRIDSYHDHQTDYEFTINAAGVKVDILQYDDGNKEDESWDAVWDVETKITPDGWVAEIKIPFRILRFSDQQKKEWGLQMLRRISRKQERLQWVLIHKAESGWTSKFGHLVGIENIPSSNNLELLPYAVGTSKFVPISKAFPDGRDFSSNIGFDTKYRPTGGMTIDATINPDFGQVEADPALLNLTTFETFYPEKRPFFIEGSQILHFTTFGGDFGPGLFYSRRIGRSISVEAPEKGYVLNEPRFATILGAAKISGKTPSGLSVGVLEAVTNEEKATTLDSSGNKSDQVVEPLTNFSLVRLRQDVWENSNVGLMATSVNRKWRVPAMTGGIDWNLRFLESEYRVDGFVAGSSTTSSDGDHIDGSAGKLALNKEGGEHWRWSLSLDFTSKNYNINDMGYFRRPNDHGTFNQVAWRDDIPGEYYRRLVLGTTYHYRKNFDDAELFNALGGNIKILFTNYWELGIQAEMDRGTYDDRETRGNGLFRKPGVQSLYLAVKSDSRQLVVGEFDVRLGNDRRKSSFVRLNTELELKLASNIMLEFRLSHSEQARQFAWADSVTDLSISPKTTSFFAQRTTDEWDLTTRGTIIFARDLTLQIYLQQFFAKGKYENFQRMTGPDEFVPSAYTKSDFNEQSFHSNVVLRWEYLPGSTLYLVWSRSASGDHGNFDTPFSENFSHTLSLPPDNVFLLKISYWMSY